jgi:hypothetical protein
MTGKGTFFSCRRGFSLAPPKTSTRRCLRQQVECLLVQRRNSQRVLRINPQKCIYEKSPHPLTLPFSENPSVLLSLAQDSRGTPESGHLTWEWTHIYAETCPMKNHFPEELNPEQSFIHPIWSLFTYTGTFINNHSGRDVWCSFKNFFDALQNWPTCARENWPIYLSALQNWPTWQVKV